MPDPQNAQIKSPILRNLTGGLNVREAITDIGDNENAASSNLNYYTAGAVVRRGAWIKLYTNAATSNPLLGVFQAAFNTAGVYTYYTVVTDGVKIYQTSSAAGGAAIWTDITGVLAPDSTQPYHFLMMNNYLVIYNGKFVCTWTGAGNCAAMPAPGGGQIACPLSRVGIVWQNYLFWGGDATNPARWYFSNLGDPTTYPTANFVDVPNAFDGDQLNGAAILYGNLLTLKRFSIYILQGSPPSNMILSKLNASIGCVDPASVVQIDNVVYFVSDKGLYEANLFNVRPASYKVEPRYLAAVPVSSVVNPIWAINYRPRNQIFISINARTLYNSTAGTMHDRVMAHDYLNTDQNQDPAVSEHIVGYTAYEMAGARPTIPTAPSIMADYFYPGNPSRSITTMSSFYDQWVYVFSEGSLASGGPADQVSWLSSSTYPRTDFLGKFFDWGDPDMIKQVRWLWTTGQNYNNSSLMAGIVYNDSPTAANFVNFNTNPLTLQSGASYFAMGVDDDGAISLTTTTDTTFLGTLVLQDSNGINWSVTIVIVGGNPVIETSQTSTSPSTNPIFASLSGYQYQITANTNGTLETTQVFAPSTSAITPGVRVPVLPLVNGSSGVKFGKYVQLYFSNIGILVNYSLDIINKGRRR